MLAPLHLLFKRIAGSGNLVVVDGSGRAHRYGDGSGAEVAVRFADRRAERQLLSNPALALGELYMTGRLEVLKGGIYELLEIVMKGTARGPQPFVLRVHDWLRFWVRRLQQLNPAGRSVRNVKHHYDIGDEIYELFLDGSRQYSCAYFRDGDDLEAAQQAKLRHIVSKLDLRAGQNVLDIGSGWGRLAAFIASTAPVEVLGITLSDNQLAGSRDYAAAHGLEDRVRYQKRDYRALNERFERVVSVGMLEHVGVNHYRAYFEKIRDLLVDDGVALVHTIGRTDGPGSTNPFIAKYIFPGGYFPALSELVPVIEECGLMISDIEVLRLHYADTLRAWRERFALNRERVIALRDENFYRMWEFYLAGSEGGFRFQGLVVYQIQLVKHVETLPTRRDYMIETERELERGGVQQGMAAE